MHAPARQDDQRDQHLARVILRLGEELGDLRRELGRRTRMRPVIAYEGIVITTAENEARLRVSEAEAHSRAAENEARRQTSDSEARRHAVANEARHEAEDGHSEMSRCVNRSTEAASCTALMERLPLARP